MINSIKLNKIAQAYIEKLILPSDPLKPLWNRESILFSKPARWNYIDGCIIKSLLMLYDIDMDKRLLDYTIRFTDFYTEENGNIPTMNVLDFNLDNINGGKNLLTLYRMTSHEKYRLAVEKLITEQLDSQPRLKCGNFSHKSIYPDQIWLDGTYMALTFLADYGAMYSNYSVLDDVYLQLENIRSIMRSPETGLYYHGYDETRTMCWADKKSGLSPEFWLRSNGWLAAALADICEVSSSSSEKLFRLCSSMLKELIDSLANYITPQGMLCQLPARNNLDGNYPETSGTLLFSYSALKAYRLDIGSEKNKTDGINALSSVAENYIDFYENEVPVLKNICLVAGLGGAQGRNGSAEYYLSETIVENDAKGIAPFLMAYAEFKRLNIS